MPYRLLMQNLQELRMLMKNLQELEMSLAGKDLKMLENYILVLLLYYFPNESYYCPTHHRRWAKLVIYQSKRSSTRQLGESVKQ